MSITFLIWSLMLAVSAKSSSRLKRSNDIPHRGLADLIDRIVNVLDGDHRFSGSVM